MTSRDGSNRNYRPGSQPGPGSTSRSGQAWELDAEELDRFMSGPKSQDRRFDPYSRQAEQPAPRPPMRSQQPARRAPQEPTYPEYEQYPSEEWADDQGYENDYYDPEPAPPMRRSRPSQQRQPMRRQPEPEYDDEDLYDDPYVMDDEEAPRSRRQQQRPPRRPQERRREAPSFTMPTFLSEAPILKDRTTLGMLAAIVLSLLIMLIVVAVKRSDLGEMIYTHVNANGEPQNLVQSKAIWRLPLIAGAVGIINVSIAWLLAQYGQFLPRFVLGATLAVNFIVWVAVYAYLF